jgi:hypothetical protein
LGESTGANEGKHERCRSFGRQEKSHRSLYIGTRA